MALGVRRQSEDCNSTARRNAECISEPNPQGIAYRANSGMQSRDSLRDSPKMHCKISVALARCARSSKYLSNFPTYNIHLLTKMTSCFFCRVSIPMSTNICEADKIKFEYIIYFSFNFYNIYMYELVSSGLRRLELLSYLLQTNLLQKKKNPAKMIQRHPSIS